MTTNIDHFNIDPCEKINADCINAFVDFKLDPDNPTGICLDTSWGGQCLDLTSIVKEAETCTSLYLSPTDGDPNCLVYEGECDTYCIDGDDLSRIISLTKLKDVDQDTTPQNGDVLIYKDGKWYPFNLQEFVDGVNNKFTNLNATIQQLINKLTPPADAPDNVMLTWGNINLYSDKNYDGTNTLSKDWGLYTHLLSEQRVNDEAFG